MDRIRVFHIPLPTERQARQLVRQIFQTVLRELPAAGSSIRLAPKTIDQLVTLSPRRMKQTLREGIGRVLGRGGKNVMPSDVSIESDDTNQTKRMGFL